MTPFTMVLLALLGIQTASAQSVWKTRFTGAGFSTTPRKICLVVYKEEKLLEVWGERSDGTSARVHTFPVLALCDTPGPKRRQGDGMTPEGLYRISLFNPRSLFHLSMKIDYPNASDRVLGRRGDLGGDLFIHGGRATAGCVAIGDPAIEELYALCRSYGTGTPVLIFPSNDSARWNTLLALWQQHERWDLRDFHANLRIIWDRWTSTRRVPERTVLRSGAYASTAWDGAGENVFYGAVPAALLPRDTRTGLHDRPD